MQHHFHRQRRPTKALAPGPKPILEMTQLPIFRVHYRRLEQYLAKVYRMEEFDFLLAAGAVPGLVPEYAVNGALPPSDDARRRADAIRAGRRTRDVPLILNVLCLDGLIPAGKYIIDTRPETPPIEHYKLLLRKTSNPLSAECIAFRDAHRRDRAFTRLAAEIDTTALDALREQQR